MGYTIGNKDHENALLEGLNSMKPGDFVLTARAGGVNLAIQALSKSDYGHAILYLGIREGGHKFLELPLVYGSPSAVLAKDDVAEAAFVHCKTLSKGQRKTIVEFADTYRKTKAPDKLRAFDIAGGATQGIGSTLFEQFGSLAKHTPGIPQIVNMIDDTAMDRNLRAAAELNATMTNTVMALVNDYPKLTCAGLVTWSHKQAEHVIDTALLAAAHTASPKRIWESVKAAPSQFSVTKARFA